MGYELRRRVADALPPGLLSSGERLVVLEIADQCNDVTLKGYGKQLLEIVAHRTGYSDTKQVGKVLGKLAKKGIELRVQLTRADGSPLYDSRGRPVFAHDSRSTTYCIPSTLLSPPAAADEPGTPDRGEDDAPDGLPPGGPLPGEDSPAGDDSPPVVPQAGDHFSTGVAETAASGLPSGGPQTPSGPPLGGQWSPAGDPVVPRPGVSGPPSGGPLSSVSPHLSSTSPQSVVADARDSEALAHLAATYGLTDDQSAIVWSGAQRMARGPIDHPVPYLKAMATTGTLARLVEAVQLAPAVDEGQDDEDDRPDLRLVDGPAPYDRTLSEALAAAYQPPILASVDEPATDRPAAPGPDEARAKRGANLARELLAERAARKAAQ